MERPGALSGETVDVRCLDVHTAIAAQTICAECIDGDDHQVPGGLGRWS
jgi:hypothetical protein